MASAGNDNCKIHLPCCTRMPYMCNHIDDGFCILTVYIGTLPQYWGITISCASTRSFEVGVRRPRSLPLPRRCPSCYRELYSYSHNSTGDGKWKIAFWQATIDFLAGALRPKQDHKRFPNTREILSHVFLIHISSLPCLLPTFGEKHVSRLSLLGIMLHYPINLLSILPRS